MNNIAQTLSEPYRREVSANERMYIAGAQLSPPFCIQALVEGLGEIPIAALNAALEATGQVNPGSRLVLRKQGLKAFWEDSGITPPVRVETESWDGYDFSSVAIVKRPFDIEQGPTCEVVVIPGSTQRLLFRAFHGVMDAQGLLLWVTNIFRALNGRSLEPAFYSKTDLELATSLNTPEYRPNFSFDCGSVTGPVQGKEPHFIWRRVHIPGRYPGLVSRLAVILARESRKWSDAPVRFMVPVDLRPHLHPQENGTGNLSNPLFLEITRDENWVSVYQSILECLDAKKEGIVGKYDHFGRFVSPSLFRWIFGSAARWQRLVNRYVATGLLSNIGKIALDDFSTTDFHANTVCFLPFDIAISPLTIITTENEHGIEVSLSMPSYLGNEGRIDGLISTIKEGLLNTESIATATTAPTLMLSRENMVIDYNNTCVPRSAAASILDLIALSVEKTPTAIALASGDRLVSYTELAHWVDCYAWRLKDLGVMPGDFVGLLLDRSIEMVLNLLAILKVGAAYVPVDPAYPKQRKDYILEDAGIKLLITEEKHRHELDFAGVCLVIDNAVTPEPRSEVFTSQASADGLAYVIYTSGSTGQPKGVEIEHRQLTHYIIWAAKVYADNKPATFPLFSSLAFDLTVTSVFTPLITGGCIQIYADNDPMQSLSTILGDDKVDIIKLTPSHFRVLLELDGSPTRLQTFIVGGEDLPTSLCKDILDRFGQSIKIFNEYGPTETTVGCMIHLYDPNKDTDASVPIGVPADNTQIYVLDEALVPVSADGIGEMYISGDGVARGYLNRQDLTNLRFVPDPFKPNQRMYRTGDLARWRETRVLDYCGRVDEQVKINGFRIEPGEIQSILKQQEDVEDAVVFAVQAPKLPAWLCAFYASTAPDLNREMGERLKQILAQQLPSYMVPRQFVLVDSIPLTVNGKVDRRKLLDLLSDHASAVFSDSKESDSKEKTKSSPLLVVWSEILATEFNGKAPLLNFYELGGDSLAMATMLRRIRQELIPLPQHRNFARQVPSIIANPSFATVLHAIEMAIAPDNLKAAIQ